jgi:DNA-binding CsgD family transcriptional regulator
MILNINSQKKIVLHTKNTYLANGLYYLHIHEEKNSDVFLQEEKESDVFISDFGCYLMIFKSQPIVNHDLMTFLNNAPLIINMNSDTTKLRECILLTGRNNKIDSKTKLSRKELTVIELFCKGMSVNYISIKQGVSIKTIYCQKRKALLKLGVKHCSSILLAYHTWRSVLITEALWRDTSTPIRTNIQLQSLLRRKQMS